ncbi:hypothetical protein ACJMK2_031065 [Sinanodonta woodiana]|uniref:Ras-associating domain-containing protein n=1 Tax=Sinanodonta woodiana TaxID=1069815 RepID=A0ABD3WXM9_SINWO
MDETSRTKMKMISVMVDGMNCLLKVTENTTCGEVIQHLLKLSGFKKSNTDSYFLFASNNITEVRLSKKLKVLKVAEDLASGTNILNFIPARKFVSVCLTFPPSQIDVLQRNLQPRN